MTVEDIIRDRKLQDDINREATKISTLSPGEIDKYEYQIQITEQTLTYSPQGKVFEKRREAIEDAAEKQTKALQT